MTIQSHHRAIIRIVVTGKSDSSVNYSRRMYAIIRRYTPEAVEGVKNECFAELTGLRTFFKMTYQEMTASIVKDLKNEMGMSFAVRVATVSEFEAASLKIKKPKNVSTYKEINFLLAGKSFVALSKRSIIRATAPKKRVRLTIPFIGKVA